MSPPPGFYTTTVDVSVTTPVAGAALYYTTDGSEPTEASSIVTGPIPITGSTELKARAFKAGLSPQRDRRWAVHPQLRHSRSPGAEPRRRDLCDLGRRHADGGSRRDHLVRAVRPQLVQLHGLGRVHRAHPDRPLPDPPSECVAAGLEHQLPAHRDVPVQAAQPLLDPVGGAYSRVSSSPSRAPTRLRPLYYTTNGVDPTESDRPIVCGGSLPAASFTLKIRAFKPGLSPSEVATGGLLAHGGPHTGDAGKWRVPFVGPPP